MKRELFLVALLGAMVPTVAFADNTYWSMQGGACMPLDRTIQGNYYKSDNDGMVHQAGSTNTITMFCPISPNHAGTNPNVMFIDYVDSTGTGNGAAVQAHLIRITRSSGSASILVSFNSNSHSNTTYTEKTASFTHTMDFDTYIYYVRSTLERTSTTYTVRLQGVGLQFIEP